MSDIDNKFEEIEVLARKMGLDPFPVTFEYVPRDIIYEVASYGLPTRMSHWSFGRSFLHQKFYGEMGFSKIYELIINNNPSYAFLDDTNPDTVNLLVAAHCYGHSDFFKNNLCFAKTNRNMVNQAEQNARNIDEYKAKYGLEAVEDWMDIAFSIDRHIDPALGEERPKYPEPEQIFKVIEPLPFADIHGEDNKPHVEVRMKNAEFPPYREKDILWFLINYANKILPWQRDILSMIRSESFYMYPQSITKIINEGWASFWHAELMNEYENLTPADHLDFVKAHAGVVSPGHGGTLNPYYVGFRILTDIKKRWDEYYEAGQKDQAFQKMPNEDFYDEKGNIVMSKINGYKKLFQVRALEDDVSFIYNYLTNELCEDMELFTYGLRGAREDPDEDDIILKNRDLDVVRNVLVSHIHNYGVPPIVIEKVDDVMHLRHEDSDKVPLDKKYAAETLKYIQRVWKKPVTLTTRDRFGAEITYNCTKGGITSEEQQEEGKRFMIEM